MGFGVVRMDPQYANGVELEPEVNKHLESSVKGLHIIGAAKASPLLKTCINEAAEVIRGISRLMQPGTDKDGPLDIFIVGARRRGKLAIVPNDECICCGECTKYCQMGIDVRSFAQRQWPLSNSTTCCIFCGICVTVCPVDVLRVERLSAGTRKLEPVPTVSQREQVGKKGDVLADAR